MENIYFKKYPFLLLVMFIVILSSSNYIRATEQLLSFSGWKAEYKIYEDSPSIVTALTFSNNSNFVLYGIKGRLEIQSKKGEVTNTEWTNLGETNPGESLSTRLIATNVKDFSMVALRIKYAKETNVRLGDSNIKADKTSSSLTKGVRLTNPEYFEEIFFTIDLLSKPIVYSDEEFKKQSAKFLAAVKRTGRVAPEIIDSQLVDENTGRHILYIIVNNPGYAVSPKIFSLQLILYSAPNRILQKIPLEIKNNIDTGYTGISFPLVIRNKIYGWDLKYKLNLPKK